MSSLAFAPSTYKTFAKPIAAVTKQFADVQSRLDTNRASMLKLLKQLATDTQEAREDGESVALRRGRKTLNRTSHSDAVLSVLKTARGAMSTIEVHKKLVAKGWSTSARSPDKIINEALRLLVHNGLAKSTDRGLYTAVAVTQTFSSAAKKPAKK